MGMKLSEVARQATRKGWPYSTREHGRVVYSRAIPCGWPADGPTLHVACGWPYSTRGLRVALLYTWPAMALLYTTYLLLEDIFPSSHSLVNQVYFRQKMVFPANGMW